MKKYLKTSEYAKLMGIHYRTAARHFHFVAIVKSFCGRIYGSKSKDKTNQIIKNLKEEYQYDKE